MTRRYAKRSEQSKPHSREKATRAARGRDHGLVANGHLQSACHASRRGAQLRKTKEIRYIGGRTPCGTQLHLGIAAGEARGSWQERAGRSERRRAQRRCGEGCEEAAHSVRRESQPQTALKAVGPCNSCDEPRPFPVTRLLRRRRCLPFAGMGGCLGHLRPDGLASPEKYVSLSCDGAGSNRYKIPERMQYKVPFQFNAGTDCTASAVCDARQVLTFWQGKKNTGSLCFGSCRERISTLIFALGRKKRCTQTCSQLRNPVPLLFLAWRGDTSVSKFIAFLS